MPATDVDASIRAMWPVFSLGLGLIIGSFANVCIYRLPRSGSIVRPASRCTSCGHPILARDNIPILSFLLLRGRCRFCRAPISSRYPLVEATNGLLYLLIALICGVTPHALFLMGLVTTLLVLSLIDLDHQILPDWITLPGIALGVLASFLGLTGIGLLGSLLGAGVGYVVFWGVAFTYRASRGVDGLGEGDWKMAAMLGAVFGWKALFLLVLIASLLGTFVGLALMWFGGRSSQHRLPFGTFLGGAGILIVFVGEPILGWYAGFYRG